MLVKKESTTLDIHFYFISFFQISYSRRKYFVYVYLPQFLSITSIYKSYSISSLVKLLIRSGVQIIIIAIGIIILKIYKLEFTPTRDQIYG